MVLAANGVAVNHTAKCRLRSVDKASWVARNNALLRRIPVVPGSFFVNGYSIGQSAPDKCLPFENGPPYSAYQTWRVYRTPKPKALGTVVRYYLRRLRPAWQLRGYSGFSPVSDATFRRGAAMLYVVQTQSGWMMSVNHAAYRYLKR